MVAQGRENETGTGGEVGFVGEFLSEPKLFAIFVILALSMKSDDERVFLIGTEIGGTIEAVGKIAVILEDPVTCDEFGVFSFYRFWLVGLSDPVAVLLGEAIERDIILLSRPLFLFARLKNEVLVLQVR